TTASFVSGEYFGLAIKLHLTQLGVQLLGCSPAAPPGISSMLLAKITSESQKSSLLRFPAVCSLFCDIFHCIFLSMNRSFFAKLMAQGSIFRCAF
ncbi:hypothetical protein AB9D95_19985, partial [Klebsiella africana]|uniref:hypothetical protein n=1 Tax=Klebsiella africana TaxID=2489010 RepID=UPI00350F605F